MSASWLQVFQDELSRSRSRGFARAPCAAMKGQPKMRACQLLDTHWNLQTDFTGTFESISKITSAGNNDGSIVASAMSDGNNFSRRQGKLVRADNLLLRLFFVLSIYCTIFLRNRTELLEIKKDSDG